MHFIQKERVRVEPAIHNLVDLVSDIANASAESGESQYLLTKRLHAILVSPRGEGRSIKEDFLAMADLYDGGLMSSLSSECPALTRNEIVLCSMISIGLNPLCISKVLGYDHEHTFYNKRADIRKKLNLQHAVPLEQYLDERAHKLRSDHAAYFQALVHA